MAHLLIAAAHKSSGKTTVSVGLAAELRRRGVSVQPFKKGPDYIDPMWLERAAGLPCINLDYNTMAEAEILAAFGPRAEAADLALIEGNKGLYDGIDLGGRDANAALAKLLGAPVILVLDTLGMTRGIAPLVLGYQAFDPGIEIAGVILNKVGGARQEAKLRAVLERYTDVPVLGSIGRSPRFGVAERHLGLVTPNETAELGALIEHLADSLRDGVDIGRIMAIASAARPVRAPVPLHAARPLGAARPAGADIRLGVARDAAFGFYYADDLEALGAAGAELVPIDTLADPHLPDIDALFIGGGFPETQMAALEANASLRREILAAARSGMPIYAECGGLLYLSRSLAWRGERREMVGFIPADAEIHDRPQGRGVVRLEDTGAGLWPPAAASDGPQTPAGFPAHEFHYAALRGLPDDTIYAYEVRRGAGIDGRRDGIVMANVVASFTHLRHTAALPWADRFVAFARRCKKASTGRLAAQGR